MLTTMNKNRQQILRWQQQGHIDSNDIDQALSLSEANNSPNQWYSFISQSALWLGSLSIAFGVIFFFAYNWNVISSMTKFTLIQVLILFSLFFYTQTRSSSQASVALLFFLALLIGALFALFGQTYQTGKDPWQLFLLWTLFITPIALISRSSSLWLLWLSLANLSLYLFLDVYYGFIGLLFDSNRNILFYALFNLFVALFFELSYSSKSRFIHNRITSQVALIITMICFSCVAVYSLFEFSKHTLDLLIYLVWMIFVYYFYRVKTIDVLVLSSWVISCIVFIISFIIKSISSDFAGISLLFVSLLIIGLSTAGVKWLMKLLKESSRLGEVS